jgi:hypothetical protein
MTNTAIALASGSNRTSLTRPPARFAEVIAYLKSQHLKTQKSKRG